MFIPRHAARHLLRLDPGRLRDGLRVLPHGDDGARAQPDGRARSSARCACSPATLGLRDAALQHRLHGHGRAAAQLRRDDGGACGSSPTSTASPCRRGASRCRRWAWCRPSSGSRART
ncbi:MAG: hypothetical protein MZV64_04580 [Ignavibacteriales bacterium]|nr:hypothetical protein [Ignavibacteriales bacterium]